MKRFFEHTRVFSRLSPRIPSSIKVFWSISWELYIANLSFRGTAIKFAMIAP